MSMEKASHTQIQEALAKLDSWTIQGGKLHREYRFPDFVQAFGFMTQVALVAERTAHHPEWFNVYNQVVVHLTTHEAQGITQKDLDLAFEMERLARRM